MAERIERRASERLSVGGDTACAFVGPVAEDFGAARIKDISMEGIGLILSRKVEAGALLAVTLTNSSKSFTKIVLLRVAHATAQPGGCVVGGNFTVPLTYQELTTLVL
jgi:hypothetical protein